MAESLDALGIHLSFSENLCDTNVGDDVVKSIISDIVNILQLDNNEKKDQIVNDLLQNGRRSLAKYEEDIITKTYKESMNGNDSKLIDLLKHYFEQKWEAQYGASNKWFISFTNQYKNGENHDIYERVLTRTAEYGTNYMKNCPILSIVLQLLFESIDDECLKETNVFDDLWFAITNDGLKSITTYSDYIVKKIMDEQLKSQSILFQALCEYYRENVFLSLKQCKIGERGDLYKLALDEVVEHGWLSDMKTIEDNIPPKSYKMLLKKLHSFYKKQKPPENKTTNLIDDRPKVINLQPGTISTEIDTTSKRTQVNVFKSIVKDLLQKYQVPAEDLDLDKVSDLLYNQKMEALQCIEELMMEKDYVLFQEEFIGHPQINDIWRTRSCSIDIMEEETLLNKFKSELKLLWTQCNVDDGLNFDRVAQQLFDEDKKVLEEVREYSLEVDFQHFQHELLESDKFKEIRKAKELSKSNHTDRTFIKFKMVMIKLLESEKLQLTNINLELLVQKLYENQDNNIAAFFKNILVPIKIKQLLARIQSSEELKTIWASNMLIFSNLTSILKKYIDFTDDNDDGVKTIISELHVKAEKGMELIKGKCTPEKFNKIKSDFFDNDEIRSKIFQEKNVINMTNIDNKNREQRLSSLVKVHPMNENQQDKKFETIKNLQQIMYGRDDNYADQLFTEILLLNYNSLEETIKNENNSIYDKSLLDIILPYILNKLKKGIDLAEICELEIFWDETSQFYGMDYKTIFVCMIERYKRHQLEIVELIKKLAIALPFAYRWVVNQKLIFKIPLRAYSHSLTIDHPMVISLGSDSIGKSTLLNKIYSAQFVTNRSGKINDGIDVVFSTTEFACGFTIFDVHDHACKQKHLLEIFFKMMPLENCWILVQSTSVDETDSIINMLKSFGIANDQVIWIVRDNQESTHKSIEKLRNNSLREVLSIRKIENNNSAFNSNLAVLREKLFKLTGIGHKLRKPIGTELRKESHNLYLDIENRIYQQKYMDIYIDVQDESVRKVSTWVDENLRDIDGTMNNLQAHLFKHVELNKLIKAEERKKVECFGKDSHDKQTEITKIDKAIMNLSQKKAVAEPSTLVCRYNAFFISKKFHLISELDKRVSVWQSPILSPLFQKRNEIVKELEVCRTSIADIQTKKSHSSELKAYKEKQSNLEKQKQDISNSIDAKIINRDIFMRELLAIYGDKMFLNKLNSDQNLKEQNFDKNHYISSFIEYMVNGNEIEIIDGDNNDFNYDIVSEIFQRLETTYNDSNNEPPFVVSVIGPQSTGKSTLLNMLFGSNFQTSAGRCTKGLYASIFTTAYPKARTLLVLDTEGLLSIEKANEEYDKKLTLFSMACSQVMLINLNGEINSSMKKILTISLFVANQLRVFKTRPIIIFVLRNMMDLNVDKQREMIDNVKRELKEVSELSKLTLNQVLDFKEEKAFFLMLTAFNKDFVYNKSEELFQKSTTNTKFAKLSQELRERIFCEARASNPKFKSLADWVKQASEIWRTIDLYNDIIMIESVKEINERKELSDIITKIMERYIEPNEAKKSFRSKLETILTEQETRINASSSVDLNVEQLFENETTSFKEKVSNCFENEVKSKSYAVKLTNEYKDRLLSAITSSKIQALQKYKAIAEKSKIKCRIDLALIQLQNRSEKQILDWQKVQQQASSVQKAQIKTKIIKEFSEFMAKTTAETEQEMNKCKKTRHQWEIFVMEQIKSAVGTIPVEKRFFSVVNLDQKPPETTSSNNIIILVTNKPSDCYQAFILEKIPLLIQRKRKYGQLNQNLSVENTTASTENTIYIEKQSNYLKRKWNQATSWILNTFQSKSHATRGKRNYGRSLTSYDLIADKISDAGISSEATVLAYAMFLEMEEYLRVSIQTEIMQSAEYQITCLKQNILQIEAKMNELNQKYLDEEELEFTHTFGNELVEWLYDIIVDKMLKDEETTYAKMQESFKKEVNKLLEDLTKRLDAAFGDAENATDMATKIYNNIKNICFSKIEIAYKNDLEQVTELNANKLVELADKVFYEADQKFDKDGIYDYITNMIDYMKKVYSKHFQAKADEIEKQYCNKYAKLYKYQNENLISKLNKLEEIFQNYDWKQSHIDHHKNEFTKFFKAYIEGNVDNKLIDSYLEKTLNVTYYHSDKELSEPSKIFQHISISIYLITNPKVFLTSFKNTIISLREKNKDDLIFNLTDDILKEKDKIKVRNQQKALGCIEQCPYCGCKCAETLDHHDAHGSNNHRLMAFSGSFEKLHNGKKGFVFDLCNSKDTIKCSRWKENSSDQLVIRDSKLVRERMNEYSVGEGDVTITLAWFDSNDLDLHVTCPCGTELYFRNKKCYDCGGYLDLDMNVCCHENSCPDKKCSSTKPAENVFFKSAKKGLYKVSVNYFQGPKGKASKSSKFQVRIQTHANNNIQTFGACVEADGERRHVKVGDYEHSASINFLEHVKKNFKSWSNIQQATDCKWEIVLKKAWWQVALRMSQLYGYENNTPQEFGSL